MERQLYRENLAEIKEHIPGKTSLTIDEVAKVLGVERKTAYAYVKRQRNPLPIMPTGKRCMRVSISALANWMCIDGRRA